jgi:hypothetical protein
MSGKTSLTGRPLFPMGANLNGEANPVPPISLGSDLSSNFCSSGLGSHVSMWDGAPDAKMWMIRLALGVKCGCRGARGEWGSNPAAASGADSKPIPTRLVRPRAPNPRPMRLRNWRRVKRRSSRRFSQSRQVRSIIKRVGRIDDAPRARTLVSLCACSRNGNKKCAPDNVET